MAMCCWRGVPLCSRKTIPLDTSCASMRLKLSYRHICHVVALFPRCAHRTEHACKHRRKPVLGLAKMATRADFAHDTDALPTVGVEGRLAELKVDGTQSSEKCCKMEHRLPGRPQTWSPSRQEMKMRVMREGRTCGACSSARCVSSQQSNSRQERGVRTARLNRRRLRMHGQAVWRHCRVLHSYILSNHCPSR